MDAARADHDGERESRVPLGLGGAGRMKKKATLLPSGVERLEGFSLLLLLLPVLVFLFVSIRTLYLFPVADSYRWYGDETWMLLAWRNLIAHGQMAVPVALGSTLQSSPGLLLGSGWVAALFYGVPQILFDASTDPILIGRTISFLFGVATIAILSLSGSRLKLPAAPTLLSAVLLVTTQNFTFASHSARYDMMTGFTVLAFVGHFAVRSHERKIHSALFAFLFGLSTALAALTVSPHLEVLLLPLAFFIAWYFGLLVRVKNALAVAGGILCGFGALGVLFVLTNHHFSLAGGIATDNQFGSVLSNLPVRHFLSWSAERHQLLAKGFYLWHEAPAFAFILPLILISEAVLLGLKRPHPTTAFLSVALGCVMFSALFFQSTLPYYLVHVLPLVALTFAAHAGEWKRASLFRPAVGLISLGVAGLVMFVWLPQLKNAGVIGKRISQENTAAIQAAIEEESRLWSRGTPMLILTQAPGVHELLRDTSIRLMTEAFLFFPDRVESPDTVIARLGVDYILDYNRPMTAEYQHAIRSTTPIFSRMGRLLDRTVDYYHDSTSELDTLTLYAVHKPQE